MSTYALWQAKTEEQLASEHLLGIPDPDNNAWWICHWQWVYSPYWRKLCSADEALQVLAWEANPPHLSVEDEESFSALRLLNQHVRGISDYQHPYVRKRVYWLKREAIGDATKRGLVRLRLIESVLPCRTCGGDGIYVEQTGLGWRPERCRRCSGRGKVHLQFFECNIADRYSLHLPYDSSHPFASHQIARLQPHPAGTWAPGKPGAALPREQAEALIERLKARYWEPQASYVKDIYGKSLGWPSLSASQRRA